MTSALDAALTDPALAALRTQLAAAAAAFSGDTAHLGALLRAMIDDVERATREPLEVFPVKHHSPASALHMVRRLRERAPKVIFMEGCEDLGVTLAGLQHCRFPVALQAFAPESSAFPPDWTPLNLVAPLTEFSAEYQAIAYCLQNPGTRLIFVDRSVDHVFQWTPRGDAPPGSDVTDEDGDDGEPEAEAADPEAGATGAGNTANLHGGAVGLQIGAMQPTLDDFIEVLLRNARVRHYSEWWTQYVEGPTLASDYGTYRQVFFLVGSLLRRIGITERDRAADAQRERYMWTRIREQLAALKIDPRDAMYVCGAIHAVSPIPEFGVEGTSWTIPPRTPTPWFYGVVPSSYAAIEHQFSLPAGEISIAQAMWDKGLLALDIKPFRIATTAASKPAAASKPLVRKPAAPTPVAPTIAAVTAAPRDATGLREFLTRPPAFVAADDEQLMRWCVDIVQLARKNGYTASTADTIAILHTATLLARMRDRPHPSPYDFHDAAITCLEKDRVPGRRNIQRLCQILLGGDRIGRVGYESLPPLAQDVYDRLAVLGINLKSNRIERALLDIQSRPELLAASDLLWRLRHLNCGVRPIMGERSLGHKPRQESWDIEIGKHQGSLIQLGYEGLTVEQVLEKRLKASAFAATARATTALEAAEHSVLYLRSGRLTRELGMRATELLRAEVGATDAPEIFQRIRALVHYYRTVGMPDWIKDFISTGYRHYATLLPNAFMDRGTTPRQLAAMLAFIFTQEALAFSMGCERSQLVIAVAQSEPDDPPKIALRWAAQWILGQRAEDAVRADFMHLLTSPLLLPAFPEYMAGFLLALEFTPRISRLAVEFMSRAFALLPDEVLVPWLPKLVVTLRPLGSGLMQSLIKEAGLAFPRDLAGLPTWEFAWDRSQPIAAPPVPPAAKPTTTATATTKVATPAIERSASEQAIAALLREHRPATDALAARLGLPATWTEETATRAATPGEPAATDAPAEAASATPEATAAPDSPLAALLAAHPDPLTAVAARLRLLGA